MAAQLGLIATIAAYSAIVTLFLVYFGKSAMGIRQSEENEIIGLDKAVHSQFGNESGDEL